MANDEKRDSVPWALLIAFAAILLTFFIVMPVMGYMYLDLVNIREALVIELHKAKKTNQQLREDHFLLHKDE